MHAIIFISNGNDFWRWNLFSFTAVKNIAKTLWKHWKGWHSISVCCYHIVPLFSSHSGFIESINMCSACAQQSMRKNSNDIYRGKACKRSERTHENTHSKHATIHLHINTLITLLNKTINKLVPFTCIIDDVIARTHSLFSHSVPQRYPSRMSPCTEQKWEKPKPQQPLTSASRVILNLLLRLLGLNKLSTLHTDRISLPSF